MAEITAADQEWNSATTLYIARRLQDAQRGRDRPLRVLDLGCGTGNLIRAFEPYGHDLHGCDFPRRDDALRDNLAALYGPSYDDHIRIVTDERRIPFGDDEFDVVYTNQVFEHVRFLDATMAECARVLRPDGTLIALFPLATSPVEVHTLVPFAHWISPGRVRTRYIWLLHQLRLGKRRPGMTALQSAAEWDDYLEHQTYYRFLNELTSVAHHYFDEVVVDTGSFVEARLDLLADDAGRVARLVHRIASRVPRPMLDSLVTHAFSVALVLHGRRARGDVGS